MSSIRLNAQPTSARPGQPAYLLANPRHSRAGGAARYWNKARQRYWRTLARYCSILGVSADPAAHTRAKGVVLDLQRRGFCETRTVRGSKPDSNH
jgi:hypothetical protein